MLKITPTRQKFYTNQLKRWPLQNRKSEFVILRANTSQSSCFETASISETVKKKKRRSEIEVRIE